MGLLTQLEEIHDLDLINEFLTDLGVMTVALDPLIVPLDNPEKYAANLDELSRIFTNIQTASFYLGVDDIASLTTLVLHLVSELQKSGKPASQQSIDWLLNAASQLAIYRDNIENDDQYFAILDPRLSQKPTELTA